jgi:hypothetical protein
MTGQTLTQGNAYENEPHPSAESKESLQIHREPDVD